MLTQHVIFGMLVAVYDYNMVRVQLVLTLILIGILLLVGADQFIFPDV